MAFSDRGKEVICRNGQSESKEKHDTFYRTLEGEKQLMIPL